MTDPSKGEAIAARREQVAGFARPEQLHGRDVAAEVRTARAETADVWRVYAPEWIITASSMMSGPPGLLEVQARFEQEFAERVHPEDVQYSPASPEQPNDYPWYLELRLPNIKGEFKDEATATAWAAEQSFAGDVQVVARNSRADYRIREYGIKKLRST